MAARKRVAELESVSTFAYQALEANDTGRATAKARSTDFVWSDRGYYVNIHDPVSGLPVACGVLACSRR